MEKHHKKLEAPAYGRADIWYWSKDSDGFVFWLGAADLSDSRGPLLFPAPAPPASQAPLQNVETFGSFLGEEIVANWRRSLERTILSQGSTPFDRRIGLPPPDGRTSTGPLAQSPVNATPPPSHTPTQNIDHSEEIGNIFSQLLNVFVVPIFYDIVFTDLPNFIVFAGSNFQDHEKIFNTINITVQFLFKI